MTGKIVLSLTVLSQKPKLLSYSVVFSNVRYIYIYITYTHIHYTYINMSRILLLLSLQGDSNSYRHIDKI